MDPTDITSDFWAVPIDVTQYYNIADSDRPHIKKIVDVFIYDRNERTYCCEITPSYYLIYLYTTIEFADPDISEDVRDSIQQAYCCYESTDDCYMHCSNVERIKGQVQYDSSGKYEQDEETVREYWQGNCPY